ncbi:hypothetical protein JBKA6_0988 [Ichthyobacterium seriolicida]|uniref:Uncharacterized protein n=1 Tax=Ichthyobacterium seriolicida TaxID=242600 RepID=A0A1J1DYN3_9FLAO|nr:hypothetical protein JBKA6_0988 [Ichthyobacterium seriolicida]
MQRKYLKDYPFNLKKLSNDMITTLFGNIFSRSKRNCR